VLDHGGLSAETLEASLVAALVGTLSSMDATVAGKTRRVGKSLAATNVLALVRLLASVCSDMDGQRTSLNEALAASSSRARVGTLVGVNPVVSLQV
jgi:hypothetical protein